MFPFELKDQDLKELNAEKAVEFFRRLIWNEAERVGITSNLIEVPLDLYSSDGGIDAFIEDANPSSDEVIPAGTTGFQIKSGKFFLSRCINELYKKGKRGKELKSGIREILNKGGTYIQVLFSEITYKRKRADYYNKPLQSEIIKELKSKGFKNPKIRVYTITQILGFSRRFPSLTLFLKPELMPYKNFDSWGQNKDINFPIKFYLDEERKEIVMNIRKILKDSFDKTKYIRINGFPGIGKTRLVYEALNEEELKHLVMYIEAERFILSEGYDFLKNSEGLSVIIVVDNCNRINHEKIINSIFSKRSKIIIITIALEREEKPSFSCTNFYIPHLRREVLKILIKTELNEISLIDVEKILDFSAGFPKIAVLLIKDYKLSPNAMLEDFKEISDSVFVNRLIGGEIEPFHNILPIIKMYSHIYHFLAI